MEGGEEWETPDTLSNLLLLFLYMICLFHHRGIKGHGHYHWHLGTCNDVTGFPLAQCSLARLTAELCRWGFGLQPATVTHMAPEIVTWTHWCVVPSFGYVWFRYHNNRKCLLAAAEQVESQRFISQGDKKLSLQQLGPIHWIDRCREWWCWSDSTKRWDSIDS